ncbi:hypothetical protein BP5796_00674 [Coleophoma crateriformis]|uniref:DSC E3 ubiquitin ligase complex subunit A n=1 Tax=Coleophoma crateriformis TaxID=565419 RepID=A0A3D8T8Z2_9HELO|nr:hypothetical protein BP5796_00674 [Coleophoma crateriformis]
MPPQQPPPQEYARVLLILIFLFYLYTSPDQQVGPAGFPSPRDYASERIARQKHALDVLNTTRWGDFEPRAQGYTPGRWLNLTGFREHDGYGWDRLEGWRARCDAFSKRFRAVGAEGYTDLNGRVYENVTGIVQGKWVRYEGDLADPSAIGGRTFNLSEVAPGVDWAYRSEEDWTRNITGTEGKMMLRIDEKIGESLGLEDGAANEVRQVAATMTIQDESSSGDGWEMRVHGVHWPSQGLMLMTTTSEKFAGIFALPHLANSMENYKSAQKLLNRTLEQTVNRLEKSIWLDASNPWTSSPNSQNDAMFPAPHCEYIVYVQVHPINSQTLTSLETFPSDSRKDTTLVHQIEDELRFPTGAPLELVPRLQMSTVISSPDCGFMLESKGPPKFAPSDGDHLLGLKQEVWLYQVRKWLLVFAGVVFAQILVLKIQMKEASTPSTIARISLFTAGIMVMADSLVFASFSLLSATAPSIFPSALLSSFAALLSVALGVRFTLALHKAQEPERRERERASAAMEAAIATANAAASPTPAVVITAAGADVPAAAAPPARSTELAVIVPSDQDVDAEINAVANAASAVPRLPTTNPANTTVQPPAPRGLSEFAAVYGQFVLLLSFILFLTLSSLSWPIPYRTAYTHLLSFIYLSIWVPQIYRNVLRNCRKALLWKFVVGQSILRLLPFAYFYLREDNILFADTDWTAFTVLAGWVWVQVWILVAQEILGPRWGLPKNWTDEGWDYHPALREDNVEAGGLPIGLMQIDSPSHTHSSGDKENVRTVDCAICQQVLEVPVLAAGHEGETAGGVTGILARRAYMVTPCRHIFHSHCLEGWMRFRLQCPICRENLPPL